MIHIFGIQFYPTPPELVRRMVSKLDLTDVAYILEPSAGKGDIIQGFRDYINEKSYYYSVIEFVDGKSHTEIFLSIQETLDYINEKYSANTNTLNEAYDFLDSNINDKGDKNNTVDIVSHIEKNDKNKSYEIDCIEIDEQLCSILRDKNCKVLNADFLTYDTLTRYDAILMNPPFKDGDKHLLKALELISHGGQVVCILNAETVKNPYSDTRKYLCNLLDKYNADVEFIDKGFSSAENTTDVEVALVYVNIPHKEIDIDIAKNLAMGEDYNKQYEEYNDAQLATDDMIGNIVKQYSFEARYGIKIIDDFYSMQKFIPQDGEKRQMINLNINCCSDGDLLQSNAKSGVSPVNTYVRTLRDKYWTLLFRSKEMSKLLTETTRQKYINQIRKFRDYDFTLSNIKQLQIDLCSRLNESIDEAILKQFDSFTYKHSMDNSTNVHYFNGWKTNSAFMVKSKVIIPMYGVFDRFGYWSLYQARDYLDELEKIFVYLDGSRTEGETVSAIINRYNGGNQYSGERISFKYFDVEFKKKGTAHIWFTNLELLKKFNIFGCQKHGWLPNSYGKKQYKDMTREEQSVVDDFEGEKNYQATINNAEFYIGGNQMLQIEMNA